MCVACGMTVTEFSGDVDPAQPVVVDVPAAPPVVQDPAEARPLGRCSVSHMPHVGRASTVEVGK